MSEVIVSYKERPEQVSGDCDLYCDENGNPIVFKNRSSAIERLNQDGVTDEQMSKMWFISCIGVCFKCGGPLFPSFLPDYTSQCFGCDEDFYSFEQDTKTVIG